MANEKHEPQGSRHPRRKRLSAAVAIFLLVLLAAGFSVRYLSFASWTIYQESTSHLEEVLHKSNNMLKEMVRKNLTICICTTAFWKAPRMRTKFRRISRQRSRISDLPTFTFLPTTATT